MSFYAYNITLSGPSQEDIVASLNQRKRKAYVSTTVNGVTVISDEHGNETKQLLLLAKDLSHEFHCFALALQNYDDGVLWYKLLDRGLVIDEYDSCPNYHEESDDTISSAPTGGNAMKLCAAFGRLDATETVDAILRDPPNIDDETNSDFATFMTGATCPEFDVFKDAFNRFCIVAGCGPKAAAEAYVNGFDCERIRHAALAAALGFPLSSIILEYQDVEDGYWPPEEPKPIKTGRSSSA